MPRVLHEEQLACVQVILTFGLIQECHLIELLLLIDLGLEQGLKLLIDSLSLNVVLNDRVTQKTPHRVPKLVNK